MGQIYTRKKDDSDRDEKTMNAVEFMDRLLSQQPEKIKKENKIESTL